MRRLFLTILVLLVAVAAAAGDAMPRRPVATYSIVARDPETGQMGVAVQSHWFSVGQLVPWAEAGVGAVATQSFVEPSYGPLGLELMRHGKGAATTLEGLLLTDPGEAVRQVAMVDVRGGTGVHTGSRCIAAAGHVTGDGFSCQANMMENGTVWDAMAAAYTSAEGDLAARLLAALAAAEGEGGDIRGRQSAAIVVVAGEATGLAWRDRIFDLRVEDDPDPVGELTRLVGLQRAYNALNAGDGFIAAGEVEAGLAAYREALALAPDEATNGEAAFWVGISLVDAGRRDEALDYLRRAYLQDARWAELVRRLPASGLLADDPEMIAALVADMSR